MKRYYITDRKAAGGFQKLLQHIRDQIGDGVDMIQIREKDLTTRELFEFTEAVLEARGAIQTKAASTKILVNTRADVAVAAGADGVHLPAGAPGDVPPGLLVGRSCHTLGEVRSCGGDFAVFGPVFESPGKGAPVGLDALKAAAAMGVPVYALGGVTWENAEECLKAGAAGVAGTRLFQERAKPDAKLRPGGPTGRLRPGRATPANSRHE
jgi:thiamine-phosphate pyrophosphorylase